MNENLFGKLKNILTCENLFGIIISYQKRNVSDRKVR